MPADSRYVQVLNGIWDIAPGTPEAPPLEWRARIPVPSLVDCAVPSYEWQSFPYHWYKTSFRVGTASPRATATVRIGQAMFGTGVWLNGNRLGEDIACYTSQEYDAAPHLRYDGPNELVVRVGRKKHSPPKARLAGTRSGRRSSPASGGT